MQKGRRGTEKKDIRWDKKREKEETRIAIKWNWHCDHSDHTSDYTQTLTLKKELLGIRSLALHDRQRKAEEGKRRNRDYDQMKLALWSQWSHRWLHWLRLSLISIKLHACHSVSCDRCHYDMWESRKRIYKCIFILPHKLVCLINLLYMSTWVCNRSHTHKTFFGKQMFGQISQMHTHIDLLDKWKMIRGLCPSGFNCDCICQHCTRAS